MRKLLLFCLLAGCSNLTEPPTETVIAEPASSTSTTAATNTAPQPLPRASAPNPSDLPGDPETELKIEDTKVGTGPAVKMGDAVLVHYAGSLKNGKKFDASRDHQPPDPLPVTVGQGVIEGFSKGLVGMKVGGKRKVTIPWKMAYGEQGRPPVIPPKATLIFELELMKITPAGGK